MSGLHESASTEMANQAKKREQREKDLAILRKAKEQEKKKKGKYVKVGNATWCFEKEKANNNNE